MLGGEDLQTSIDFSLKQNSYVLNGWIMFQNLRSDASTYLTINIFLGISQNTEIQFDVRALLFGVGLGLGLLLGLRVDAFIFVAPSPDILQWI